MSGHVVVILVMPVPMERDASPSQKRGAVRPLP